MKTKDTFMKYVAIAERMENLGFNIARQTLIMDIESADLVFNLKLDDLLNADDLNFAHDVVGIVNNINRAEYPATDFGLFVPRFASTEN